MTTYWTTWRNWLPAVAIALVIVNKFAGEPIIELSGLLGLSLFLSGLSMGMSFEFLRSRPL